MAGTIVLFVRPKVNNLNINHYRKYFRLFSKLLNMPPDAVLMRVRGIFNKKRDRFFLENKKNFLSDKKFLKQVSASSFDELFNRLATLEHPCQTAVFFQKQLSGIDQDQTALVISRAKTVIRGEFTLLGFEFRHLQEIDWYRDYKSGYSWPYLFFDDIDTLDLDRNSDVKMPWELSRLQWLIPVVQAWMLTGDETYAFFVKKTLEDWIGRNPYGMGVNWACTMEPSMRVFTWTWMYQVLGKSTAWNDHEFKKLFLKSLYDHLRFVYSYIEITDVNGNHLLANAAALHVGGTFFGHTSRIPGQWLKTGMSLLERELKNQVYDDGVDFEGSVPYHRFVTELFFFPAVYCEVNSLTVSENYKGHVKKMAAYIKAYTKPDGTAPVVGDADDARVLPMGRQRINDHRYLYNLIGSIWESPSLISDCDEKLSEMMWWKYDQSRPVSCAEKKDSVFPCGGSYIARSDEDYLFIDCGPLGLRDRGGHGHNDCLSFEAVLCGVNIVCDPGCYVYTGDYQKRNLYRSTFFHNTPMLAGQEINRFIDEKNIWFLHGDAKPRVLEWMSNDDYILFKGSHTGYQRLDPQVNPVRTIIFDKRYHAILIHDEFSPGCRHSVKIPLHTGAEINITNINDSTVLLDADNETFVLEWEDADNWRLQTDLYGLSSSYGVQSEATKLIWTSLHGCEKPLTVVIYPEKFVSQGCLQRLTARLRDST